MKPPVQFLDLKDIERITQSGASSTFAILDPVITIEKSNGKLEVAARFNLEVKPYPVFSREENKKWPHARYIDAVRLTHHITGDASLVFEPETDTETDYTVTESTQSSRSLTTGGGFAGLVPSANVAISIVKGGKIEVVSRISPWACNASREPRTKEQMGQRFSWEWISNLGENPTIPDTAFRGVKWPVAVRRTIDESSLQFITKGKARTRDETAAACKTVAELLHFEFSIKIDVRELGYGGILAHWEKYVHWLRPYKHPKNAYDPKTNRGQPIKNNDSEFFCLGPHDATNFTEADLEEIESNLGPPGVDTDSLQDARKKVYEEYARTGLCSTHIPTYTEMRSKPSVVRFAEVPEVEGTMVDEQIKNFEGRTKVSYIAKRW